MRFLCVLVTFAANVAATDVAASEASTQKQLMRKEQRHVSIRAHGGVGSAGIGAPDIKAGGDNPYKLVNSVVEVNIDQFEADNAKHLQEEARKAAAALEARKQAAIDKVADAAAAKVKAANAFNIPPGLKKAITSIDIPDVPAMGGHAHRRRHGDVSSDAKTDPTMLDSLWTTIKLAESSIKSTNLSPSSVWTHMERSASWEPAEKTTLRRHFGVLGLLSGVMVGVLIVTTKSTKAGFKDKGEQPEGRWQCTLMSFMDWFKAYRSMMCGMRDKGLATQEAATKIRKEEEEAAAQDQLIAQRHTEREPMLGVGEMDDDQESSASETEAAIKSRASRGYTRVQRTVEAATCQAKVDHAALG